MRYCDYDIHRYLEEDIWWDIFLNTFFKRTKKIKYLSWSFKYRQTGREQHHYITPPPPNPTLIPAKLLSWEPPPSRPSPWEKFPWKPRGLFTVEPSHIARIMVQGFPRTSSGSTPSLFGQTPCPPTSTLSHVHLCICILHLGTSLRWVGLHLFQCK